VLIQRKKKLLSSKNDRITTCVEDHRVFPSRISINAISGFRCLSTLCQETLRFAEGPVKGQIGFVNQRNEKIVRFLMQGNGTIIFQDCERHLTIIQGSLYYIRVSFTRPVPYDVSLLPLSAASIAVAVFRSSWPWTSNFLWRRRKIYNSFLRVLGRFLCPSTLCCELCMLI
jgi:hypothetical protein